MSELHSINTAQRLYVLRAGDGFTALGFDVAQERAERLANALGAQVPDPAARGTEAHYNAYRNLLGQAEARYRETGRRFECELTPQLSGLEGARVEVTDAYGETRRFQVGRSTGWLPIHLEVSRRSALGGAPVTGAPFRSLRVVRPAR